MGSFTPMVANGKRCKRSDPSVDLLVGWVTARRPRSGWQRHLSQRRRGLPSQTTLFTSQISLPSRRVGAANPDSSTRFNVLMERSNGDKNSGSTSLVPHGQQTTCALRRCTITVASPGTTKGPTSRFVRTARMTPDFGHQTFQVVGRGVRPSTRMVCSMSARFRPNSSILLQQFMRTTPMLDPCCGRRTSRQVRAASRLQTECSSSVAGKESSLHCRRPLPTLASAFDPPTLL